MWGSEKTLLPLSALCGCTCSVLVAKWVSRAPWAAWEWRWSPCSTFFIYILIYILLYFFFLAVLGLHCCTWAFSSCGKQGLLFVAVHGLLIVVAPLARGLRVSLPVQGTPVRCLVGEDPTCHRAVSPCTTAAEPTLSHPCYTFTPPLHLARLGEGWEQVFSAGRRWVCCVCTRMDPAAPLPDASQGPRGNHAERSLLAAVKGEWESSPGRCILLFHLSF